MMILPGTAKPEPRRNEKKGLKALSATRKERSADACREGARARFVAVRMLHSFWLPSQQAHSSAELEGIFADLGEALQSRRPGA